MFVTEVFTIVTTSIYTEVFLTYISFLFLIVVSLALFSIKVIISKGRKST